MNTDEIIQSIQAVSKSKLTSFELEEDNMKLSLECKKEQPQILTVPAPSIGQASIRMINTAMAAGVGVYPVPAQEALTLATRADTGSDKVITSPLMGTFYASSSSDVNAFVEVGDTVKKGQVLGIIEAMKLMNEVENEYNSVAETILVSSEEVVKYGQPLFRIK